LNIVIELMTTAASQVFPREWQQSTIESKKGKYLDIFSVTKDSVEWKTVETAVRRTLNVKIDTIERIQNTWLWDSYSKERDKIALKNGRPTEEKLLFHGTSKTDPKNIYNDEIGFDFRHSSGGMWGPGSYFATNASYSKGYSFNAGENKSQFFLVSVIVGEVHTCEPNAQIKLPPPKQHSGADFQVVRYDSVAGTTGGSLNYVIYDHRKAYPLYLITFSS